MVSMQNHAQTPQPFWSPGLKRSRAAISIGDGNRGAWLLTTRLREMPFLSARDPAAAAAPAMPAPLGGDKRAEDQL